MQLDAARAAVEAAPRLLDRPLGEVEPDERDQPPVRPLGRLERAVVRGAEARVPVGLVHAEDVRPGHAVGVHDPEQLVEAALHAVDVVAEVRVHVEDLGALGKLLAQLRVPEGTERERAFVRSVHRATRAFVSFREYARQRRKDGALDGELSFRVLGPLEVWRNGQPLRLGAAKQRALLGLLLIRRGEVPRDVLVEALWGERPPKGARNTLQVYVSRLRPVLGRGVIVTTPGGYRLDVEPGAVDAGQFESLFREGSDLLAAREVRRASALLSEGLGLWRGPAFADLRYEAFAQVEAGRLDELRLACVEERIEAELQLGHHSELVGELEALVVEHPLRERLRAQLILALYRSHRQSEALAQYQAARRMLADELGLEPSPELRELERMILSHDPGLAAPPTPPAPLSTLPLQPTPFIGRENELAELLELIRGGRRRLVTLTGAGGSGKTRLAIEAASRLVPEFGEGVWWVPLHALTDPELVLPTIADAVDAKGDLSNHIGDRRMLVLIDNFEHLLDAGPEVAALLTRCPGLFVLTTSREPLHVAAEREYRVLPMTRTDAVALFDERAVQSAPEGVVADICERLDCLPLAVELAAARTTALHRSRSSCGSTRGCPFSASAPETCR